MAGETGAQGGTAIAAVSDSPLVALRQFGGRAVGRMSWGVADQGVSSLTNFAVSIYVARNLGAVQLGAFSLAYVTYGFALNASRGLATDPLMVRFSTKDLATWRRATAESTGTSAVVGTAVGLGLLITAAILHGATREAYLALAITMPGLLLQDGWRYSFFALGRGSRAFLNDLIWALVLLPTLYLLNHTGHGSVFWFVLAWGLGATVGAAIGPLQARVLPSLRGARRWLSQHRDLGPRYFLEGTSGSIAAQLRVSAIGVLLGLAAVGYLQASLTLMGPVTILFLGMFLVIIPEAGRVLRRSPRQLPLFCLVMGTALALATLGWGLVLLIAVPRGLGSWLLGPIWRPAYPLLLPTVIAVVGQGFSSGAAAGLKALAAAKRSLRATLITAALVVTLTVAGAVLWGIEGAVWASAVASWAGALLLWWQLRAAMHECPDVPVGSRFWSNRAPARHRKPAGPPSGDPPDHA